MIKWLARYIENFMSPKTHMLWKLQYLSRKISPHRHSSFPNGACMLRHRSLDNLFFPWFPLYFMRVSNTTIFHYTSRDLPVNKILRQQQWGAKPESHLSHARTGMSWYFHYVTSHHSRFRRFYSPCQAARILSRVDVHSLELGAGSLSKEIIMMVCGQMGCVYGTLGWMAYAIHCNSILRFVRAHPGGQEWIL